MWKAPSFPLYFQRQKEGGNTDIIAFTSSSGDDPWLENHQDSHWPCCAHHLDPKHPICIRNFLPFLIQWVIGQTSAFNLCGGEVEFHLGTCIKIPHMAGQNNEACTYTLWCEECYRLYEGYVKIQLSYEINSFCNCQNSRAHISNIESPGIHP